MTFVAVPATTNPTANILQLRWVTDAGGRLVMSWTTDQTAAPRPVPVAVSPGYAPAALAA